MFDYENLPSILLDAPKRKEFGDLATNVAMLLASDAGKPSRTIAEIIKKQVEDNKEIIKHLEIAGPGFINIFISKGYWYDLLRNVVVEGDDYGRFDVGKGEKIQVEFVSANPTGPLHIGHGRGAAIGDSIANILEFVGYDVTREYYINDVGKQMETLGLSVFKRYQEIAGEKVDFPEEGYQGDYIKTLAKEIFEENKGEFLGDRNNPDLIYFSSFASDKILKDIIERLKEFNVSFDVWYSEKNLFDKGTVDMTLSCLEEKGLAYKREKALWFASTDFGDDKDRVLRRSDGKTTYFASDIAYHKEKFERGFQKVINIWGGRSPWLSTANSCFLKSDRN